MMVVHFGHEIGRGWSFFLGGGAVDWQRATATAVARLSSRVSSSTFWRPTTTTTTDDTHGLWSENKVFPTEAAPPNDKPHSTIRCFAPRPLFSEPFFGTLCLSQRQHRRRRRRRRREGPGVVVGPFRVDKNTDDPRGPPLQTKKMTRLCVFFCVFLKKLRNHLFQWRIFSKKAKHPFNNRIDSYR